VHAGPVPGRSNLAGVKLLGRKNDDGDVPEAEPTALEESASVRTTAPKGRPTPKRSQSEKRRGPVAPAPMTSSEARKRRKEMRATLTKEERKADKLRRRAAMTDRREKMMAGEEDYLLPRDKGPVRRYVRDIVDSRRNLLGLFMPAALFMIFVMLSVPKVQLLISPAMLVLMAIMGVDAVLLARKANKAVAAKFPENTEGPWKLGLYAAGRASQLRRMRAPRPRVERGAKVT
jgi:hypothetical protein